MTHQSNISNIIGWFFGLTIFTLGILNLILVHPVPGVAYLLISFLFFPPVNVWLRKKFGFSIPLVVLILLGIAVFWFTLGISDLAEMYGL